MSYKFSVPLNVQLDYVVKFLYALPITNHYVIDSIERSDKGYTFNITETDTTYNQLITE